MKLTRTWQPNWALIGLVPFINVIFLVLIFFALSSHYLIQPGVAVSMPFSPFKLSPQRNPQVVSMTSVPTPAIYFHDRRVSQEELAKQLGELRTKERTLIVKADRATPYESVVTVMTAGLKAGFSVVLAGGESPR